MAKGFLWFPFKTSKKWAFSKKTPQWEGVLLLFFFWGEGGGVSWACRLLEFERGF